MDVPQRIAEWTRSQSYDVTTVLDPEGDSATTIVAAVGFPSPVDAVAPRGDANHHRLHEGVPFKDQLYSEYRETNENGKSVDEFRQIC